MIDKAGAVQRANEIFASFEVECVLLDEQTREEPFGWVFFYQSAAYVETGDMSEMLTGNAPLVVFRDTGEVRSTGTAHPIDHYLAPIREEWARRQG